MKSIDTLYKGNYYRSRLEAKWAYFFDILEIEYLYEPTGFISNEGEKYLPDFYLPNTYLRNEIKGLYIEIKHDNFDLKYMDKISKWFTLPLIAFKGIPFYNIWGNWYEGEGGEQIVPPWDNFMRFWICEKCKQTKIEFSAGNYDDCPICDGVCNNFLLHEASILSMKKRFEHGENN